MIHGDRHPPESSAVDIVFLDLIDQLTDLLQAGDAEELEAWLGQHPEHADRLRQVLPTLQIMEGLVPSAGIRVPTASSSPRGRAVHVPLTGTLGDFQIVREIGRGGMGVVFEAEQISLNRRVALKVLPLAGMLDERQIQRFRNEAQAAALLHHENIVPIHGVGCDRGLHYYSMQYIEGRTLADVLDELRSGQGDDLTCPSPAINPPLGSSRPTDAKEVETSPVAAFTTRPAKNARWPEVARIGMQVAAALEHAHSRGVTHRDIKPSNLLLDRNGKTWVTDFGLARIESAANLTLTGDVVGTLRYMSPEQACGHLRILDHRTDIYSLGIVLYELLALRPAFAESDRKRLLRQVMEDDPPPLRRQDPDIPRDLETIVLKAMNKTPEGRYASAQEFASDLQAFLTLQPIRARRPTLIDHVGKWSQRHRLALAAVSTTLLLAVIGLVVGMTLILQERDAARAATDIARAATANAEAAAAEARQHAGFSQQLVYAGVIRSASQAWKGGDIRGMTELLDRYVLSDDEPDRRGFEWWFLQQQGRSDFQTLCQETDGACVVRHSRTGRYLAVGWQDGNLDLWDARTQRRLATVSADAEMLADIDFSPQNDQLVSVGYEGIVRLWELPDLRALRGFRVCEGHGNRARFGLDGTILLTSGDEGHVRLWDPSTGMTLGQLGNFSSQPQYGVRDRLACSPDGRRCVVGDRYGKAQVFDIEVRKPVCTLGFAPGDAPLVFEFSPDGRLVAAGTYRHTLRLWNAATGTFVANFTGHTDAIQDVAFHPGGSLLASSDRAGVLRVWDLTQLQAPDDVTFEQGIQWSTFLPDGRVCVWTKDNQLLLHDLASGSTRPVPLVDSAPVATFNRKVVCASPDGKYLLCRSEIYDVDPARLEAWHRRTVLDQDVYNVNAAVFSADGRMVATVDAEGKMRLWEAESGQLLAVLEDTRGAGYTPLLCVAFSPDGQRLAVAGRRRFISVGDVSRLDMGRQLRGNFPAAWLVAFSPDGRWLAAATRDRCVHVWDVETGQRGLPLAHPSAYFGGLAFSPEHQVLATITQHQENRIRVWDFATGKVLASLAPPGGDALNASFSPDGQRLAVGGGQTLRLYRWLDALWSQSWPQSWRGHPQRSWSLEFSPDGRQLVTCGREGSVRVWPARRRYTTDPPVTPVVTAVAFTASGDRLFIAAPGHFQVWNRQTGKSQFLADCSFEVQCMSISENRTFVTGHADGKVRFWDIASGRERLQLQAHNDVVRQVLCVPHGDGVLTIGGNMASLWDLETGEQRATLPVANRCAAAFSPDGNVLAVGEADSDAILLLDRRSLLPIHRLLGHETTVTALAFSPDGRHLASSSDDRTVRVWHAATGELQHVIHAHRDEVSSLAFSPDGRTIASGDESGLVAFSHAKTGRFLFDVEVGGDIRHLQFSRDGGVLAVVTDHCELKLLVGQPTPAWDIHSDVDPNVRSWSATADTDVEPPIHRPDSPEDLGTHLLRGKT